jgi:hypothetical protein
MMLMPAMKIRHERLNDEKRWLVAIPFEPLDLNTFAAHVADERATKAVAVALPFRPIFASINAVC